MLAREARQLSALAELLVVRDCAQATVVYDMRSGDAGPELRELGEQLREQLRQRAQLPADAAAVVELPLRHGGLGLTDLVAVRDAHVLTAGLRVLTAKGHLTGLAWEALARDGGASGQFFRVFSAAARAGGFEVDVAARTVHRAGKQVLHAPRDLPRVVAEAGAAEAEARMAAAGVRVSQSRSEGR